MSVMVVLLLAAFAVAAIPMLNDGYRLLRTELPDPTKWFLRNFARHNDAAIGPVVCWLALPMALNFVRAHFKYRDAHTFAVRFLFGLAACWLMLAMFVMIVLLILSV